MNCYFLPCCIFNSVFIKNNPLILMPLKIINSLRLIVVTKIDNDCKQPQTSTKEHKQSQTTSKQSKATSKRPQTTTNYQQTTTNNEQTITNYQQTTTNDQIDLFQIPNIYFFCNLETRQSLTDVNKH